MGADRCLWRYVVKDTGRNVLVEPPAFEIDGRPVGGSLARVLPQGKPAALPDGATETVYAGHVVDAEDLILELVFRLAKNSPLVSFQYRLRAKGEHTIVLKEYVRLDLKEFEPQGVVEGDCVPGARMVAADDSHALLVSCKDESMRYCLRDGRIALCTEEEESASLSGEFSLKTPWFVLGAIAGDKEAILAFT
jgi:hypothetical protein